MGAALVLAVCGQRAAGEDVPRLTFAQLVDSIRANFEVTQAFKSYNGKEVEILYDPLRVYKIRGAFECEDLKVRETPEPTPSK